MDEQFLQKVTADTHQAVCALLEVAGLRRGEVLVVGCSSSEVLGEHIGKAGSMEVAAAIAAGLLPPLKERGIFLAAQCCEHLNRALIVESEAAERFGWEPVTVVPQPHAGGSFASCIYRQMAQPVAVEAIRAHAGLDIGDTLIGMHLKAVAVPVRLPVKHIGAANLVCARTRPKYIGGPRAVYQLNEA